MAAAPDAFGQNLDLCGRLREILHDYPDNSALKEMLQNADDAGATVMRIAIDRRQHATEGLPVKFEVDDMQGPALVVANDAVFTEADMDSIQSIGRSGKKDNLAKTGRFGIGFNSVYHIAEMPSFVSGSSVCFFDPSLRHLPRGGPGFRLDFSEAAPPKDGEARRVLLEPYSLFGCRAAAGNAYDGTLFRLPLRSAEQAERSLLRKVPYTMANVESIFGKFRSEACEMLLFLKNVRRLELYDVAPAGADGAAAVPDLVFEASLPRLADASIASRSLSSLPAVRSLEALRGIKVTLNVDVTAGDREERWMVRQSTGGGRAIAISCDESQEAAHYGIKLLAWGGVAAAPADGLPGRGRGKAFCFLPMPVETGLPVHVNGYFELPSDRRGIFWGVDDTGEARFRSEWNRALLEDVIAVEYQRLLKGMRKAPSDADDAAVAAAIYELLPPPTVAVPWNLVSAAVLQGLADDACVWCGPDAKWRKPKDCLLAVSSDAAPEVPAVAGSQDAQAASAAAAAPAPSAVVEALRRAGVVLADVPPHAADALCAAGGRRLTPEAACRALAEGGGAGCRRLEADEACAVLEWLLEGLPQGADPSPALLSLPLVPTLEGGVASLAGGSLAWTDREDVLELLRGTGAASRVVDSARVAPFTALTERMQSQHWRASAGVVELDRSASALFALVPLAAADACAPDYDATGSGGGVVHAAAAFAWAERFWAAVAASGGGGDVSPALGWRIVPCRGGYLCALAGQAAEAVRVVEETGEVEGVADVLKAAGVHVAAVAAVPGCVEPGTVGGVLRALHGRRAEAAEALREAAAAATVREWLVGKRYAVPEEAVGWVRELPVWRVHGGGGGGEDEGEKKEEVGRALDVAAHCLPPTVVSEGPAAAVLGGGHVRAESEAERALLVRSGVREATAVDFWRGVVAGGAAALVRADGSLEGAVGELFNAALVHGGRLAEDVRAAPVVPTEDGGHRSLEAGVFDPESEVAAMLPAARVVAARFAAVRRGALETLGMRRSLDKSMLLELCGELAAAQDAVRAAAMFEYVDRNHKQMEDGLIAGLWKKVATPGNKGDIFSGLRQLAWVPVLTESPHAAVPLCPLAEGQRLMRPEDVRPAQDLWLCSATRGILATGCSRGMAEKLGWAGRLPAELLVRQLLALSEAAGEEGAAAHSGDGVLNGKVLDVYAALETHRAGETLSEVVLEPLSGRRVVWVGDRFAAACDVAEGGTLGLPGLHTLPATLNAFLPLLRRLGLRREFSGQRYAAALRVLEAEQGGKPLGDAQLEMALSTLMRLQREGVHDVRIPDAGRVLRAPEDLLYDDMQAWGDDPVEAADLGDRWLVHDAVSHAVAERFGVVGRRTVVASEGVAQWDLSSLGATAYGQSESITSRISNILNDYIEDVAIMNELLQNADDAGATEFTVMLDKQEYGKKTVLGSMEDWQGPALVVHNDAQFTDQDFNNLASVGKGAKLESPSKTGKFGLGFNAVYHLTDVPSILSGGTLVFLDPHRSLKGATEGAPGLRMKVPSAVFKRFPDQFEPYRVLPQQLRSDLAGPYDGTLFRFPLRTEATAHRSEISKLTFGSADIEEKLRTFATTAGDLLLFLKHVRTVRVLVREADGTVAETFSATMKMNQQAEANNARLYRFVAGGGGGDGGSASDLKGRLEATPDADLPTVLADVRVVYRRLSPDGQVLMSADDWVLSCGIGGGEAKRMAIAAGAKKKLVPWGGVAMLRSREGKAPEPMDGRAFAFLPLPLRTGVGYHINGAFELSANRRNLWSDDFEEGGERSGWNVALLKEACAPAAARIIRHVLDAAEFGAERIYTLLPGELQGLFQSFADELYERIAGDPVLFAESGKRVSPSAAVVSDFNPLEKHFANRETIGTALLAAGRQVVANLPEHVVKMLCKHGSPVVSPAYVRDVFREVGGEGEDGPPKGVADAAAMVLLSYAASDLGTAERSFTELHGLRLIPTVGGKYRTFCAGDAADDIVYWTFDGDLFKHAEPVARELFVDSWLLFTQAGLDPAALAKFTNVRGIAAKDLERIVSVCLAPDLRGVRRITTDNKKCPTYLYTRALWSVVDKAGAGVELFVGDESLLAAWPLLRTEVGCVSSACSRSLLREDYKHKLEGFLKSVLLKMGIETVTIATPRVVQELVGVASAARVVSALCELHGEEGVADAVAQLADEERDRLATYFAFESEHLEFRHVTLLSTLPMFRLRSPDDKREWAAAKGENCFLSPAGATSETLLDQRFFMPRNVQTIRLLEKLGATRMAATSLYESLLRRPLQVPQGDGEDGANAAAEASMKAVHNTLSTELVRLLREGAPLPPELVTAMKEQEWVRSEDGRLRRPCDLCDPAVNWTANLPKAMRPDASYRPARLETLGMHTKLTWATATLWAESLSGLPGGAEEVVPAAQQLLQTVQQAGLVCPAMNEAGCAEYTAFLATPCVPAQPKATGFQVGYPWRCWAEDERTVAGEGYLLLPQNEVWPPSVAPLCSGVYGIALRQEDCFAKPNHLPLSFRDSLTAEDLLRQLLCASDMKASASSVVVAMLYDELSRRLGNNSTKYQTGVALDNHAGEKLVFVGDSDGGCAAEECFAAVADVALANRDVRAPFLYSVPDRDLGLWVDGTWKALAKQLRIRECFRTADYVRSLTRLAEARGSDVLNNEELRSSLEIVALVAASSAPKSLLHAPDDEGVLRKVSELVYDDMPHVKRAARERFVHASVAAEVAMTVGILSRRLRLARDAQQAEKVPCATAAQVQARLRELSAHHLLRNLFEAAHVLKAKEVTVALDDTSHDEERVIPSTEEYQAPGLLFHVDACVTVDEMSRLFGGKHSPPGDRAPFTTCFIVADTVQVVCDERLILFNPLHDSGSYTLEEVGEKFPTQLRAFQGLDASRGTTLRLTLRERQSDLGHACDVETMSKLLDSMAKAVPRMLPLLPNLLKVSFLSFGGEGGEGPRLRFRAELPDKESDPRGAVWASKEWSAPAAASAGLSFLNPMARKRLKESSSTFPLTIDVHVPTADGLSTTSAKHVWAVCLYSGGGAERLPDATLSPVGGAAALLRVDQTMPSQAELLSTGTMMRPIPAFDEPPTGFPVQLLGVHVAADVTVTQKQADTWNAVVTANAFKAYAHLLVAMCATTSPVRPLTPDACYAYWPDVEEASCTVHEAGAREVYQQVASKCVFLSHDKKYHPSSSARFAYSSFNMKGFDTEVLRILAKELNIFQVPHYVAKGMRMTNPGLPFVGPGEVRNLCMTRTESSKRIVELLKKPAHVVSLLELAAHGAGARELKNVHLLPLGDGPEKPEIVTFGTPGTPVFVGEDERVLVTKLRSSFVHEEVMRSDKLRPLLLCPDFQSALGLQQLRPAQLLANMPATPGAWKGRSDVSAEEAAALPKEWLQAFWRTTQPADVAAYKEYPVLPLQDGTLVGAAEVHKVFIFEEEAPGGEAEDPGQDEDEDEDEVAAPVRAQQQQQQQQQQQGGMGWLQAGLSMLSGVVGGGRPVEEEARPYDAAVLRPLAAELGLRVVAGPSEFTGGTRFQPPGTVQEVMAAKLRDVSWEGASAASRDAVLGYAAESPQAFTSCGNLKQLPIFKPLVASGDERVSLTAPRCCAAPADTEFFRPKKDTWYASRWLSLICFHPHTYTHQQPTSVQGRKHARQPRASEEDGCRDAHCDRHLDEGAAAPPVRL